jgi:hypothetical protein
MSEVEGGADEQPRARVSLEGDDRVGLEEGSRAGRPEDIRAGRSRAVDRQWGPGSRRAERMGGGWPRRAEESGRPAVGARIRQRGSPKRGSAQGDAHGRVGIVVAEGSEAAYARTGEERSSGPPWPCRGRARGGRGAPALRGGRLGREAAPGSEG